MDEPPCDPQIPASAAPFFQEYDLKKLHVGTHAALIIERILAYGNRAELRWLVAAYGWEQIKEWIAETGVKRLPKGRYRLWCLVFDLPQIERLEGIWNH
jgi:hypothetical protein